MRHEKSAGLVVFNKDRVLLVQNINDQWLFPKGHVEKGETSQEAALRETEEETNIKGNLLSGFENSDTYFFKLKGELIRKEVDYFVAEALNDDAVVDSKELKKAEWIPVSDAENKLSFKNLREIFKEALEFVKKNG